MRFTYLLFLILFFNCALETDLDPIQFALQSNSEKIRRVADSIDHYEVQIKLSVINRDEDSLWWDDYEFNLDDSTYYYPASTVKFPISILALEKIQQLDTINMDTPFFVEGDSVYTSFRHEIKDIFAVSSNDTYNRLFEFLGKDQINDRLNQLKLGPVQINHRLSVPDADELETKSLIFKTEDSILISTEPIYNSPLSPHILKKLKKGNGYYSGGELVEEPMDFSFKNYLPLSTIHEMMKRLIFSEKFSKEKRFDLNDEHREFLIKTMAILPKEMDYELPDYYDGYGKFFLYGDTEESIPDHIKIHNKVGYAYGYLTDCAYIIDNQNEIEYILSATIHVNENGIYNDDTYEYEEIGIPFLAELGREIHKYLIFKY